MLEYLSFGTVYAFACVAQPGPFQAYLISQSLTNGWRRTLPMIFAPLISDGPIALLTVYVLSALPPQFLPVLQIGGGLLLLYLAFGAYKAWRTFDKATVGVTSGRQNVINAALVNFLNPAPYLGWSLVLAPMLLRAWREAPANGIALLFSFYGTMVAASAALVIAFAAARNFGQRVNRVALGLSVVALACFGLYQLWSGFSALQNRTMYHIVTFSRPFSEIRQQPLPTEIIVHRQHTNQSANGLN